METAKESMKCFLKGLREKNVNLIAESTQITGRKDFTPEKILSLFPNVSQYEILEETRLIAGVYDFIITINGMNAVARVIRETGAYMPDPTGENGEWGVNPKSIVNSTNC